MENPQNPNTSFPYLAEDFDFLDFNLSDYLSLEVDGFRDHLVHSPMTSAVSSSLQTVEGNLDVDAFVDYASTEGNADNIEMKTTKKKGDRRRVVFRTKSELENMDDGYKWRKYGKKSVKNSPNPRNYYRCSSGSCQVKKRVERDGEDSSYVITTYEGVHNHGTPYSTPPYMYLSQSPATSNNLIWSNANYSQSSTSP